MKWSDIRVPIFKTFLFLFPLRFGAILIGLGFTAASIALVIYMSQRISESDYNVANDELVLMYYLNGYNADGIIRNIAMLNNCMTILIVISLVQVAINGVLIFGAITENAPCVTSWMFHLGTMVAIFVTTMLQSHLYYSAAESMWAMGQTAYTGGLIYAAVTLCCSVIVWSYRVELVGGKKQARKPKFVDKKKKGPAPAPLKEKKKVKA